MRSNVILISLALAACADEPTTTVIAQHSEEEGPYLPSLRTEALYVDDVVRVGSNYLHDVDGIGGANAFAIRSTVPGAGTQLAIYQDGYSNPVTMIGGLIPGSDNDDTAVNYGTYQGRGTTFFKFPVGFNGQTHPDYTIDILSDEPLVRRWDPKIKIGWAGTASFDTSEGPLWSPGIEVVANFRHDGGTAPLHAVGIHVEALVADDAGKQVGDHATALWTERGKVRLDGPTTIGLPDARVPVTLNSDAVRIESLATTAQPGINGTLLEVRTGGPRNYVSFGNPDASTAGFVFNNDSESGDGYVVYKRSAGMDFGTQNATRMRLTSSGLKASGSIGLGLGANDPVWLQGSGSPEGVVAAPEGSFYSRTDAATGPRWYVKEYGAALPMGWVAK